MTCASTLPMTPCAAFEKPARASLSFFAGMPGSLDSIVDPFLLASFALLLSRWGTWRHLTWATVSSSTGFEPMFLWEITALKDKPHEGPVFFREAGPKAFAVPLGSTHSRSANRSTWGHKGSGGEGVSSLRDRLPDISVWISPDLHILRVCLAKACKWGNSGRFGHVGCS